MNIHKFKNGLSFEFNLFTIHLRQNMNACFNIDIRKNIDMYAIVFFHHAIILWVNV